MMFILEECVEVWNPELRLLWLCFAFGQKSYSLEPAYP
jgi:hypothetical protein